MESARTEKIAFVASVAAALAAGCLPRWLRIVLVLCLVVLACAGGLVGYRYATHPITLSR